MTTVLSIIGAVLALVEIAFIIYKYSKETTRKRRSETILVYNQIFNDTYILRDEFYKATNKNFFVSDDIRNNSDIYKAVMNHLTVLESFAKGLEYGVYDFKTFVHLTPNELYEILNSLCQFVFDERKNKSYRLLFHDFIIMTNIMNCCIDKKLNGKTIRFNYSKLKRKLEK